MHVKHPLRLSSQLGLSSAMRMDDFIDEAAAPCCTKDARRFPSHVLQKCIESSSNDPSNEANYIHVNLRSIDILFEQLPSTKFIYYRNLASHINHTDTHWPGLAPLRVSPKFSPRPIARTVWKPRQTHHHAPILSLRRLVNTLPHRSAVLKVTLHPTVPDLTPAHACLYSFDFLKLASPLPISRCHVPN
ncbi:unnamed protein product [Acanthocheilonema viteae]|uniref:Uncharacterized protein n=1 Tax=Acanthocheilonema viteae TaxID=6277 RepID=A0A498SKV4_ACAVI|nr:unnamed protein product [Acanthocheilonema viteae]